MSKAHFLVTGGAGFIGSALVNKLLQANNKVIIIDDFSRGNIKNLNANDSNLEIVEGDIRNLDLLKSITKHTDTIIHTAASPQLLSLNRPVHDIEVNSIGTLNVLLAALDSGVVRILYTSTSSVYGNLINVNMSESDPINPVSPYAVSKYAGEHYCKIFAMTYNLAVTVLRYFNVYGIRGECTHKCDGVIPIFCMRTLNDLRPIIYGNGKQTRDFTYIDDVVSATLMVLEKSNSIFDIFNIGTGIETSINELISQIMAIANKSEILMPIYASRDLKSKTGDVFRRCANIDKISSQIGWRPQYTLIDGVNDTIRKILQRDSL